MERTERRLTFHSVGDNFLSLLGRALSEPVVTEQRCDLVGVHQLPRHEGQRAKRHLFTARWMEDHKQRENRLDKAGGRVKEMQDFQ